MAVFEKGPQDEERLEESSGEPYHGRHDVEDRPDGFVGFPLHAHSSETRQMIESLLVSEGVSHTWEGTTLITVADLRPDVEDVLDHALAVEEPAFADEDDRVAYEVAGWPVDAVTRLTDALTAAEITYVWDSGGDLVVLETDEDEVDEIVEGLELDGADLDAPEDAQLHLSDLFVAADRLARDAQDHRGVLGLIEATDDIERLPLPFGFEANEWRNLVAAAIGVRSQLEADEAHPVTDGEIRDSAKALRELLRAVV